MAVQLRLLRTVDGLSGDGPDGIPASPEPKPKLVRQPATNERTNQPALDRPSPRPRPTQSAFIHTFNDICLVLHKEALEKPLNPVGLFFPSHLAVPGTASAAENDNDAADEATTSDYLHMVGLDKFVIPPKRKAEMLAWPRTWINGSTFLPNCQWAATPNPSHLFFATSIAMEWSRKRPDEVMGAFERVVLAYCPDPRAFEKPVPTGPTGTTNQKIAFETGRLRKRDASSTHWDVGVDALQVAFANWADPKVGLLPDLDPEKRFPRYNGVVCFKQLTTAYHFGNLLAAEDETRWLSLFASKYPSQRSKLLPDASEARSQLQQRCQSKQLRIAIWQRESNSWAPRSASNMDDAASMVGKYSSVPVARVTANFSTSTEEHIELFNSFDLLISAAGSQLAGLVFSGSKRYRGVLEWGICMRMPFWALEARKWGVLYEFSHGHQPTDEKHLSAFKESGACSPGTMGAGSIRCKNGLLISNSGFTLNLDRLKVDLERALDRLCERAG